METFDWRPGEYFLPSREKNLAQGRKLKKKEREKKRKKRKRKKEKKISLRERKFWTMMTERGGNN